MADLRATAGGIGREKGSAHEPHGRSLIEVESAIEPVVAAYDYGSTPASAPRASWSIRRWTASAWCGAARGFTDAASLPSGQVVFVGAAQEGRDEGRWHGPYVGSVLGVIEPDGSARYTMIRERGGAETRRCGDGLAMLDATRGHLVFNEFGDTPASLCEMEVRGL